MKFTKHHILAISMVAIVSCSAKNQVIVDPVGVDMAVYQQDLSNCRQIAEQVDSKGAKGAIGGAIVGALIGAAIGNSDTAQKLAGVGAVSGGAKGAVKTKQEKDLVVKNCMRGRGYRVLN
jgi:outer membrane lipoprotein SlyB